MVELIETPRSGDLKPRELQILDFVRKFWRLHGYGPTYRDIKEGCHLSSTSVAQYNVRKLERRGRLVANIGERIERSIRPAGVHEPCPLCGK